MAHKKPALTLALGTAFAASLAAAPALQAAENPFQMESLKNGFQIAQADKQKDGKCGGDMKKDGKCGGDMKKKKEKEGGGDKK